jgi:hypothetical protein
MRLRQFGFELRASPVDVNHAQFTCEILAGLGFGGQLSAGGDSAAEK